MPALNRVQLIGHLGRDPETRFTSTGKGVTQFSLAVSNRRKSPTGETKEYTEWINVEAWERLGEICKQYLHKGQPVYVEGRLQTRGWEDQEGKKHFRTELVANEVIILGDRRGETGEEGAPEEMPSEDEFPF